MTQCIVVKSPSPISFAQSPIVRVASRLILAPVFHMHRNSSHIPIGYLFFEKIGYAKRPFTLHSGAESRVTLSSHIHPNHTQNKLVSRLMHAPNILNILLRGLPISEHFEVLLQIFHGQRSLVVLKTPKIQELSSPPNLPLNQTK